MRIVFVIVALVAALVWLGWRSGETPDVDALAAARAEVDVPLESETIDVGDGVRLHVVMAGPEDGPPVLLIHGFPEFWYSWRRQIADLAERGYRVAAPDLKGYNRSDKPEGREIYAPRAMASDLVGLMDALGWDAAHVAGHDVGAVVAWALVFDHPARVRRAVIFNVASPAALYEAYEEMGAESVSWYRTFFRAPVLPEFVLRLGGWRALARSMQDGAAPGAFTDEDIAIYKAAWARDDAMSTMLGFYRARPLVDPDYAGGPPPVPVRLILAGEDPFLPAEAAIPSRRDLGVENVETWEGVSHWILQEEPARTAAVMAETFRD